MSAKTNRRRAALATKRQRKLSGEKPSGESRYARKAEYCRTHGVWGFEVPEPKPW